MFAAWAQKLKHKLKGESKQVADLKAEVKRLMLPDKHPILMSQSSPKFALMMSAFHNYEKLVGLGIDNRHACDMHVTHPPGKEGREA